jgi:hypothetical protein
MNRELVERMYQLATTHGNSPELTSLLEASLEPATTPPGIEEAVEAALRDTRIEEAVERIRCAGLNQETLNEAAREILLVGGSLIRQSVEAEQREELGLEETVTGPTLVAAVERARADRAEKERDCVEAELGEEIAKLKRGRAYCQAEMKRARERHVESADEVLVERDRAAKAEQALAEFRERVEVLHEDLAIAAGAKAEICESEREPIAAAASDAFNEARRWVARLLNASDTALQPTGEQEEAAAR